LEARESARADRLPGLARWQFERVHRGIRYDIEVDTSILTAQECALRIQRQFRL
ncbi:MAG: chloramphenicol phosphotransferase, partial [Mesorhizobium sp.]